MGKSINLAYQPICSKYFYISSSIMCVIRLILIFYPVEFFGEQKYDTGGLTHEFFQLVGYYAAVKYLEQTGCFKHNQWLFRCNSMIVIAPTRHNTYFMVTQPDILDVDQLLESGLVRLLETDSMFVRSAL